MQLSETPSFDELLRSSLLRETSTRATCPNCKQFAPLQSNRLLTSKGLPPVISINAMVASGEVFDVWRDRKAGGKAVRYLPKNVGMSVNAEGGLKIEDGGVRYEVRVSIGDCLWRYS
jgi:PAB-dependent poly(A)-specific ribonuclease subunit 2